MIPINDLDKFILARWQYSIGEPIMSDAEYTILLRTIEHKYPDSEYVHRSWSSDPCPVDLLKMYGYEDSIRNIILSDKTESIPSINDWGTLKMMYGDLNEEATLSFKHDGWNVQASYYNGELVQFQTRGRASDAMSVANIKNRIPQKIPKMGKYTVCMEATVSNENYRIIQKELNGRSQRGAVASCLARPEYSNLIDLHAFSIIGDEQVLNPFPVLESWGFTTVYWMIVHNYDELISGIDVLSEIHKRYDSPTDGLVLRGSMTRAIRVADWEEPIYHSYVTGYDETYGMHRMGIKAIIRPVAMKNSTQRLVSCTNYQRIIDNDLRIGYPIAFRLSSMAIADLDEESTRLLHEEWRDRWEEYREEVDANEEAKHFTR